jgi:energy-coupling factor transporter ATP-binding protein EcfA2
MSQTNDQIAVSEDDIRAHYTAALQLMDGFDHSPRIASGVDAAQTPSKSPGLARRRAFRTTTPGLTARTSQRAEAVHLISRIETIGDDDGLTSPLKANVLQGVRRALAVSFTVAEQFAARTPLVELKRQNREGRLPAAQKSTFSELLMAEALVTLFVFGSASAFILGAQRTEDTVEIGEIDEFLTENAQLGLHGVLWALDQAIADFAGSEQQLVATVLAFAEVLMEQAATRAHAAPGLEAFRGVSWRVAEDGFTVDGFTPSVRAKTTALTMSFKKPHEVVGNHIAKYQAMKLAKMLMAYDFDRGLNPFAELGGFIFTFMGDGKPGTGKTTLIQMMAGLVNEYCQVAGYPFRYQNLSTDNIDSYQGKSGQNAKAFIQSIIDPRVIGFGTIDDIDQLAGKRGDRQSSAGQLEITAVLMESFAGANTVVRGNCTFGMFSNYPENVDDALRQRAGARFLVDGPQTQEDYIDILYLLMGKNHDIPVGQHEVFSAQEIKRAVARSFEAHAKPHEAGLLDVFDQVSDEIGDLDTLAKLGTYLKAIQKADPRFTGRAIKNITDAVKTRAMDFELPDLWMEEPDVFLFQDYAVKKDMIAEMQVPVTSQMVLQEINRYADSEFRYADKSDEVAIADMIRDYQRSEEAKRRIAKGHV